MATFNLLTEPWIPCELPRGGQVELGLIDTLARAHDLGGIGGESPLTTASLVRLLLAVLDRALAPQSLNDWKTLYRKKRFEEAPIRSYLERWAHRFDLFHHERPFYQSKTGMKYEPRGVEQLVVYECSYGAPVNLFEHRPVGFDRSLSPAQAARWLVVMQAYARGGLTTRAAGEPPSAMAAPLVSGAVVVVRGESLFETLMLNLIPRGNKTLPRDKGDAPAWEQDEAAKIDKRSPKGWTDLLTWQSRRVLFSRDESGRVKEAIIAGGVDLDRTNVLDPMMAYKTHVKLGILPVAFDTQRVLFRDATALFQVDQETRPPAMTGLLSSSDLISEIGRARRFSYEVYGLVSDQAKVLLTRRERVPISTAFFENRDLVRLLQEALQTAEHVAEALDAALRRLGEHALSPGLDPFTPSKGRRPLGRDVSAIVLATGAKGAFWAALREEFERFMEGLSQDDEAERERARTDWKASLRRLAIEMYRQAGESLGHGSRGMKARSIGQFELNIRLKRHVPKQVVSS